MMEIRAARSIARLREFVGATSRLVERAPAEDGVLEAGQSLMRGLIAHDDWLPDALAVPHPVRYRQYLLYADPLTVRWMIVGLIVPLLVLMMAGWRYPHKPTSPVTTLVGGIAGFFGGVAQVGGPPIVLYWLRDATAAAVTRASFILYFALADLIILATYLWGGLFTQTVIGLALIAGPAFGIGLWIGSHMFGLASEATFRRVCYAMIAAAAFVSLPIFDGLLR